MLTRRGMITGLIAFPAVVHAENLMRIVPVMPVKLFKPVRGWAFTEIQSCYIGGNHDAWRAIGDLVRSELEWEMRRPSFSEMFAAALKEEREEIC